MIKNAAAGLQLFLENDGGEKVNIANVALPDAQNQIRSKIRSHAEMSLCRAAIYWQSSSKTRH